MTRSPRSWVERPTGKRAKPGKSECTHLGVAVRKLNHSRTITDWPESRLDAYENSIQEMLAKKKESGKKRAQRDDVLAVRKSVKVPIKPIESKNPNEWVLGSTGKTLWWTSGKQWVKVLKVKKAYSAIELTVSGEKDRRTHVITNFDVSRKGPGTTGKE